MSELPEYNRHLVLLGDSIFDNAAYVPGGTPVIEHLRQTIPDGWQATLLAVDGNVTVDVAAQTNCLPPSVTHLVISVGGNDALQQLSVISEPVSTVGEALHHLAAVREDFRHDYRRMLCHVKGFNLPMAVCTIYNSVPGLRGMEKTALALFNEIILQEAFMAGVPVIDLRLICNEFDDYSLISPIEPSHTGGGKIARAIHSLVEANDFTLGRSTIISTIKA